MKQLNLADQLSPLALLLLLPLPTLLLHMSLPLLDLSPPPILSRQSKPVLETLPSFFFNSITRPEVVLTPKSVVSFNFFWKKQC